MNPPRPLIDLLLRSPEALDEALEQPQAALSTTSRLLPLALGGLLAYGFLLKSPCLLSRLHLKRHQQVI